MVHEFAIVNDRPQGDTVYRVAVNEDFQHDEVVNVEPLVRQKFRNVVRQAYDYSCGSAALESEYRVCSFASTWCCPELPGSR